jgi:DNA-binding SARP family transcriptional activator
MDTRTPADTSGTTRAVPWRIELLGGIAARRERTIVNEFRTRRAALLLARLALNPRPHRREELIVMFWPQADENAGRQNLSQSLSELRRRLEAPHACDFLFASRETVWLDRAMFSTDVEEFEQALRRARDAAGADRAALLDRAVTIASAPLLPGVDLDWAVASRERVTAECDAALRELVHHHRDAGDFAAAFEYAWRRVRIDPLDEEAHREFAEVYAAVGRTAEGLRHLQLLEQDLATVLGRAPSDATRELAESLRLRLHHLARQVR